MSERPAAMSRMVGVSKNRDGRFVLDISSDNPDGGRLAAAWERLKPEERVEVIDYMNASGGALLITNNPVPGAENDRWDFGSGNPQVERMQALMKKGASQ